MIQSKHDNAITLLRLRDQEISRLEIERDSLTQRLEISEVRLDKLERYLSDPEQNIYRPYGNEMMWIFRGRQNRVEGQGRTIREAIDSLPEGNG